MSTRITLPPGSPAAHHYDQIALVLQGGGALGAYQAGVYEALHEAGLEPDWVAGVSIGGFNSAIIAGNPPERRLDRLREFWNILTARKVSFMVPDGDEARRMHNSLSWMSTVVGGQPGFFKPNFPGPLLSMRGSKQATSYYDTTPMYETLHKLVDFDLINSGKTRFAVGAVNVTNGNFVYFDNTETQILPDHVMASGAIPPAFPMVQLGSDYFWDGGIVSNTPLMHLLTHVHDGALLAFQVDLFSARGNLPRDMQDVLARQKDITFSSRTRMVTDYYRQQRKLKVQVRDLLARIPDSELTDAERAQKLELANLPEINLNHLIYQQAAYERQSKDAEFSASSMRDHWDAGYRDTVLTITRKGWPGEHKDVTGILIHDIHNMEG